MHLLTANKDVPRLSQQLTPMFWQNIPENMWKLVKNGWKTSLLFIWSPWSLVGVCQCTGSVYSAIYGIHIDICMYSWIILTLTVCEIWPILSQSSDSRGLGYFIIPYVLQFRATWTANYNINLPYDKGLVVHFTIGNQQPLPPVLYIYISHFDDKKVKFCTQSISQSLGTLPLIPVHSQPARWTDTRQKWCRNKCIYVPSTREGSVVSVQVRALLNQYMYAVTYVSRPDKCI